MLKRCKLKDDLNKKLQHRPGPLELITKKILQADVELEQALQGSPIVLYFFYFLKVEESFGERCKQDLKQ